MIHELKNIVNIAFECFQKGEKCVLASVVALDGTSYRQPGVRMLITEHGKMVGAVSGGCVEKDIQQRAKLVFENNQAFMMAYDGRYRLGCQGTLYILIEPFQVNEELFSVFNEHLESRVPLELISYFEKSDGITGAFGTKIKLLNEEFQFSNALGLKSKISNSKSQVQRFIQTVKPFFKLLIIGAEHDAVKLCTLATNLGWEVDVVSTWRDPKSKADFPEAKNVFSLSPEMLDVLKIDSNTAVVLMTHNYALDLKYLLQLQKVKMAYLGVLGSFTRNEQLKAEFYELSESLDEFDFYGPVGLDIGAETPEEIAISILAEIITVTKGKVQNSLSARANHKIN